ncbi:MAG: ATP-dependent helicase [Candidatus Omnitrophica bacterium]|nr:ATP-dependent helicase [Candidatus Omnitrophota bacterium]
MQKYILKIQRQVPCENIDYAKHLNPEQLEVVKNADGPCLVLAGAGSGKTRTLIYRVAYLLERGIDPHNILLTTFTNKASHQMRERVEMLLKKNFEGLWCGTFHHIGNRLLRMYGKHIGIKPGFNIMDEEDSLTMIKSCLRELNINTKDKFFPAPRVIQSIMSYSRNTKSDISDTLDKHYPEFLQIADTINAVYSLYTKKKAGSSNLDYDDLLTETLRLITQSQIVRDKLSAQFQHILVDEYQDTNILQSEIITLLSERHGNILVVGDDAQSIYAFRGAAIENILNFPKQFTGAKIFRLETNYRSNQSILDLANESISYNSRQYEKHLHSVKDVGEKPALINLRDPRQQAMFVIQKITELNDEGYDLKKIAVLFRAHYQSAELEMELLKKGIPYVMRGGMKFFEQAHIKDVLAYLKIAQNPFDEIAWIRALSTEEGIGAGFSLKIFKNYTEKCASLKDIFNEKYWGFLKNRTRRGFEHFRRIIADITKEGESGNLDRMLESIIKGGYEKYCASRFDNYKDRLDDLKELVNFAHTYNDLKKFLADTSLGETFKGETVLNTAKDAGDYLVLSTIHQAKGLEWDAVILIGLIDNQFPHAKSKESLRHMEEERRLFYVAITRAKDYLYMLHPMTRYDYNYGIVIARPSMFIEELPENVYTKWEIEEGVEVL